MIWRRNLHHCATLKDLDRDAETRKIIGWHNPFRPTLRETAAAVTSVPKGAISERELMLFRAGEVTLADCEASGAEYSRH
ncbi:hypothetical protein AN403_6051 [Pseudomonas fluorescens]|uniref:Uncharacterized protein n=1 Tax=Pseudomonas fluorescens TaxID=294 RepID=A0A0P8X722_PSEFL|nr:hypothetical protein AN403_6051 [Pseudomonas fluorescens]